MSTCQSCGKRGRLAADYDGQCETCYNETIADWHEPSAPEMHDGWIPCSARMPPDDTRVLADCGRYDLHTAFYSPDSRCWYAGFHDEPIGADRVIAWRPLPPPRNADAKEAT